MVAFNNTFGANVSAQYMSCIVAAEQIISSFLTNPITISLYFDAAAYGTNAPLSFDSSSLNIDVSYTALRTALTAHANNPNAQAAVATLPDSDPSLGFAGNHAWTLPIAYARMLGLSSAVSTYDASISLNTSYAWSYHQDVIALIERRDHEKRDGPRRRPWRGLRPLELRSICSASRARAFEISLMAGTE